MKLPRDISSARLIKHLERHWGYAVDRQSGSHIVLTTKNPRHHSVPMPNRDALGTGLFRNIVKQVSDEKGISVAELLRDL